MLNVVHEIIPDRNHIVYSSASDVKVICAPLIDGFDVSHFSFVRRFNDSSRIHLTMNPDWGDFFYNNYKRYLAQDGLTESDDVPSGFLTWEMCVDVSLLQYIKNYYNTVNGIVVIDNKVDYSDLYFYGLMSADSCYLSGLLNNINLLHLFQRYFVEKASQLIFQAQKSPVRLLRSLDKPSSVDGLPQAKIMGFQENMQQHFIQTYRITKRELECGYCLLECLSAKEIARQMSISFRTVEKYIDSLKIKLYCRNIQELVVSLSKLIISK